MHVSKVAKVIGTNNLALSFPISSLLVVVAAASRRVGPFPIGLPPPFGGTSDFRSRREQSFLPP